MIQKMNLNEVNSVAQRCIHIIQLWGDKGGACKLLGLHDSLPHPSTVLGNQLESPPEST